MSPVAIPWTRASKESLAPLLRSLFAFAALPLLTPASLSQS